MALNIPRTAKRTAIATSASPLATVWCHRVVEERNPRDPESLGAGKDCCMVKDRPPGQPCRLTADQKLANP
jgi:hypothetical protein